MDSDGMLGFIFSSSAAKKQFAQWDHYNWIPSRLSSHHLLSLIVELKVTTNNT